MSLSDKQIQVAESLAMGDSKSHIARQFQVDRSTIYAWLKLPEFREKMKDYQDAIVKQELAKIQIVEAGVIDSFLLAVEKLREILERDDLKPRDAINAIKLAGDHYEKVLSRREIERLQALENQISEIQLNINEEDEYVRE